MIVYIHNYIYIKFRVRKLKLKTRLWTELNDFRQVELALKWEDDAIVLFLEFHTFPCGVWSTSFPIANVDKVCVVFVLTMELEILLEDFLSVLNLIVVVYPVGSRVIFWYVQLELLSQWNLQFIARQSKLHLLWKLHSW